MTDPLELLRHLPPPTPLSTVQVARIRARIPTPPASVRTRARRLAFGGAFALLLVGSAALAMYLFDGLRHPPVLVPAPEPPPSSPSPEPTRLTARDDAPPPTPRVVVAVPIAPRTTRTAAPIEEQSVTPPSIPEDRESALGMESRLLATALNQLRAQRSPRAALTTLDDYAARFPHGALAAEARAARVESLVALGDRRGALAVLDEGSVKGEQAVLRGELRLDAGRAGEAARDFELALIGTTDALEQRALFGRAAARVRLGDHAGARRDLEDYLRRFPNGASATAAQTALQKIR